jgi:Fe-S cluster assembly iron-binding protein IscA
MITFTERAAQKFTEMRASGEDKVLRIWLSGFG